MVIHKFAIVIVETEMENSTNECVGQAKQTSNNFATKKTTILQSKRNFKLNLFDFIHKDSFDWKCGWNEDDVLIY